MSFTVLVSTDLSPRADRAVQRAFRIAAWLDGEVILLSVIDEAMPADMAEQMRGAAELKLAQFAASIPYSDRVRHDTRVLVGDPPATIPAMAEAARADLLVLGLHRPRPFLDMLRETTMERIVRHSSRPVLLVRDPVDHAYARVLAALDFAPASTAALVLADRIAPEADLCGVHAVHVPYHGFVAAAGGAGTGAPFLHHAERQLAAWRAGPDVPGRLGEVEIMEGAAHTVLARQVEALRPDLLALGAHGRAGAAPSLLGSLANDMMRDPPCDLLIARAGTAG
ncbi:nucleotide-binding universal stress UspA family protein [Rhodovulum iodosum]|uniref:Nucleotide-binding universal stress UspA family protein n=1 Tax=Rhodovulum iodosum TaxID=68291 RepID=A0ABV3XVJ6_9RHOB|nr:universal stress protein [Rhodovulum robiginosum]RSK33482.1 universal stress protein [Rhodovulum robiginosum]